MKNIELLGLSYTEEMIDVLVRFQKHMENKFADKITSISEMQDIMDEQRRYYNNLNEDEQFIIAHFSRATSIDGMHPVFGMLVMIPIIFGTCFIASFGIKVLLSAMIAGVLTIEIKILCDKLAYKKIINIIEHKTYNE